MISVLIIIILITVGISMYAFNNRDFFDKNTYVPYLCQHEKQWYRVVTHLFIHGDTAHLLFNMFSLYFLGKILLGAADTGLYYGYGLIGDYGTVVGSIHFVFLYLAGGLFATVIPFVRRKDNPHYAAVGASGAVSAVIFAAILCFPTMELSLLFLPIPIPAYIFGPLYILFEIYMDRRGGSGIAHDAHLGGALFGVLYMLVLQPNRGLEFINLIFG